ncbi:MAG: agmatine deiminase family protein [Verrucomicrobia bacterium]|nr:MAG: agmatine deiminase family protein [Verrucomicrobiota bacterium]
MNSQNKPFSPTYIPVRTPASDGLYMPAEWETHAACWMAWPSRNDTITEISALKRATAEVAAAIARFEPVKMLAAPELMMEAAAICGPGVEVIPQKSVDAWVRDSGPTYVVDKNGGLAGIDWMFNGWGHFSTDKSLLQKPTLSLAYDVDMALHWLHRQNCRRYVAPFVLEGGAFHVDGEGTLLVTEQCQFDPARNPGLTKEHLEELYKAYLGIEKVIWLGDGLEDDSTRGHVDIIACFVAPGKIMLHNCSDPSDANYAVSQDAIQRLENATDAKGRKIELILMPQPQRQSIGDWRLDLTYINFYIANGAIIMPSFDDDADDEAYDIMAKTFPDREIVQVLSYGIFQGGGGIHCITQQQPLGEPLPIF